VKPLPQNRDVKRSWDVNASSTAPEHETDTGTAKGLDGLFSAHFGRIARVIGRVIHDAARAEELAVEVFLKWSRTPKAQGEHAEGWLYRTAVRDSLDELRRQARKAKFERLFAPFREAPHTPEQVFLQETEQHRVRAVLSALDRRHAELLLLWAEDLTYREMADALAIQPSYVGSLLSRAQAAFRKEYVKRYGHQS
jgi:RNA polymerase sigma-70 factor, ECF subfamily